MRVVWLPTVLLHEFAHLFRAGAGRIKIERDDLDPVGEAGRARTHILEIGEMRGDQRAHRGAVREQERDELDLAPKALRRHRMAQLIGQSIARCRTDDRQRTLGRAIEIGGKKPEQRRQQ